MLSIDNSTHMKNIKFKGEEYLFGGNSLDEDGFIAKREAFEAGVVSFAHYSVEQGVMRYKQRIGSRNDIEIISDADDNAPVSVERLINILTHPSWKA